MSGFYIRSKFLVAIAVQLIMVLALGSPAVLRAQGAGATLSGTVNDPSGAIVTGAHISVKNTATGIVRETTTNPSGFYTVPSLQAGTYDVTVSNEGFKTEVEAGVVLEVGAAQVLNVPLSIGQTTQSVEVVGAAPIVQLGSSSISAEVNGTTVRELPLNGRDWTQLANLQPGVSSMAAVTAAAGGTSNSVSAGTNRGYGSSSTINGARPQQNAYRLDGINVNNYASGSPGGVTGSTLGVDAVQEFSVLTSNLPAEYGRTSGGEFNAISKSGTNTFHGSVYEFFRNSALDSRNYFDPAKIPAYRHNQYGVSAGGPIRKDKTFVFGNFEGLSEYLGVSNINTVPSAAARTGHLCSNPTGVTPNCTPTTVTVNPVVVPFLAAWPNQNGQVLGNGDTAVYSYVGGQITHENFVTTRLDHKLFASDNLTASYQYDKAHRVVPDPLGNIQVPGDTGRQFFSLQEDHIFTARTLNSFRVGYNRNTASNAAVQAISAVSKDPTLATVPGQFAPSLTVPGLTNFSGGPGAATTNTFSFNAIQGFDDMFISKGIHSLKFGFSVEEDSTIKLYDLIPGGAFTFNTLTTFLQGTPKSFAVGLPGPTADQSFDFRQSIVGGYIQDDVRLRPNLTVNVGLRYEMATIPIEEHGKITALATLTSKAPQTGGPIFSNPTLKNFEPRLGFAWDPSGNGKTAIRSSFGIFDSLPFSNQWSSSMTQEAPFGQSVTINTTGSNQFPTGAYTGLNASNILLRVGYVTPNPPRSYMMQWSLNLQRSISENVVASLAYVGSRGMHLANPSGDANIVLPTLTSAGYLWPAAGGVLLNTSVGKIDYQDWGGQSTYHSLQAQLEKRFSHGIKAQAAYTWGKSIDEGSSVGTSATYANSINYGDASFVSNRLRRGLSDFNVGQNLNINYLWEIATPGTFTGPATWAIRGWELGGIAQVRTGFPFTAVIGGDPLGQKSTITGGLPNQIQGGACVNPGNPINYIKTQCFALPIPTPAIASLCRAFTTVPGTCSNLLGDEHRNSLVGPGLINYDFSAFKNNPIPRISEAFNVQFRAELFNILNHTNFNSPATNNVVFNADGTTGSSAGLINATSTTSRQIQFAVKVIW